MSLKHPVQDYSKIKPRQTQEEKWSHKRSECVAALRAGWSVHAVVRATGVPEPTVRRWKTEENIPNHTGPKKPMPEVGQKLT